MEVNSHVPEYLLGYEEIPELIPSGYSPGSEDEAVICYEQLIDVWEDTEGAMEWLEERVDKL